MKFQHLYGPPQKWPVPRGTPMLGPIIKWDHSLDWPIITKEQAMSLNGGSAAGICYTIDPFNTETKENKEKFLLHHVVDGRSLYPFTGYAVLAWKTLAKLQQKKMEQMPVVIEDLTVSRPVILQKDAGRQLFLLCFALWFELAIILLIQIIKRIQQAKNLITK